MTAPDCAGRPFALGMVAATKRLFAIAALPLLATLLTGCGTGVCAGAAALPPQAFVQVQPWLAAHPAGVAHACYARSCADASATHPVVHLTVDEQDGLDSPHTLTVMLTADGHTVTRIERFALKHLPSPAGLPCPMPDTWARNVLISADGELHLDQVSTPAPAPNSPIASPTNSNP